MKNRATALERLKFTHTHTTNKQIMIGKLIGGTGLILKRIIELPFVLIAALSASALFIFR